MVLILTYIEMMMFTTSHTSPIEGVARERGVSFRGLFERIFAADPQNNMSIQYRYSSLDDAPKIYCRSIFAVLCPTVKAQNTNNPLNVFGETKKKQLF